MTITVMERVYTNEQTCRTLGVLPFRASVMSFTMNGESDDGGSPRELLDVRTDHHLKPKIPCRSHVELLTDISDISVRFPTC